MFVRTNNLSSRRALLLMVDGRWSLAQLHIIIIIILIIFRSFFFFRIRLPLLLFSVFRRFGAIRLFPSSNVCFFEVFIHSRLIYLTNGKLTSICCSPLLLLPTVTIFLLISLAAITSFWFIGLDTIISLPLMVDGLPSR